MEPDTIVAVVERADSGDVAELIDTLEGLAISEQLRVFTESYEQLLATIERASPESREAAVRVVAALSPAMGRLVAETTVPNYATPGDDSFDEGIDREIAVYVAALEDEAPGVREAAVRGIESVSMACRISDDRTRLEALYEDLEAVGERVSPAKREHVEQAKEHAFENLT
jgi:hypothetical protein